jgi:GNAT superfamily N-acetyltransferase
MNASHSEIRALEAISGRAWPPRERIGGTGWEARFADGMHRRVNSATVWGSADPASVVRRVEAWYAARGRPAIFKLTEASAAGLDTLLEGEGYRVDATTLVETRSTDLPGDDGGVEMADQASARWLDAFAGIQDYGPGRRRLLEMQIERIVPDTGFASIREGGRFVAVGLAVRDASHVGIFELATDPVRRGRGLATRVVERLIGWGRGRGATVAYLQVMEDNPAGLRLYERLGFEPRYRYWYRVAPGDR